MFMGDVVTVSMPLFFETGKKKIVRRYINMNAANTWHFQVKNQVKKKYEELAWTRIYKLRFSKKIKLEFVLWKKDKRLGDRSNVLSIHEKFFCDALTRAGCIPDDNDDYIEQTLYRTGGIDAMNPRVDIIITELDVDSGEIDLFS